MIEVDTRKHLLQKMPKHGIVAELGVYRGKFSNEIMRVTKPGSFYLVDLWEELVPPWPSYAEQLENRRALDKKYNGNDNVFIIVQDTRTFLEEHSDGFFDWIYIDSKHGYYHIKSELIVAHEKVKPDGFICGHDYTTKVKNCGVIRAVGEFCADNGWRIEYLTSKDPNTSYALKRI